MSSDKNFRLLVLYVPHILGTAGMIDDGQDGVGVLQIRLQGPETAYYAGLATPPHCYIHVPTLLYLLVARIKYRARTTITLEACARKVVLEVST